MKLRVHYKYGEVVGMKTSGEGASLEMLERFTQTVSDVRRSNGMICFDGFNVDFSVPAQDIVLMEVIS